MMKNIRHVRQAALCSSIVLLAACAGAQQPHAATPQLPEASVLIDRYVQAIGGREAVLRPGSMRTVSRLEYPATGLRGQHEVLTAQPDRMLTRLVLPGLGEVRSGYDGEVGWVIEPMGGARIAEGGELAVMRDQAWRTAAVRDASLFISRTTVGETEVDGTRCYRVRLAWKSGRESDDCYGVADGLLVATFETNESPLGAVDVTTLFGDYREFGGVRLPTRTVQRMLQSEIVLTVESVEIDGLDAALFALPPEIRAIRSAQPVGSPE
jgi:hypothetical protein